MGNVYTETIVDYYQHPRKKGTIAKPTAEARLNNPSCGDDMTVRLKVGKGGMIEQARFDGNGCAISTASASLLMERIEGRSLESARKLGPKDVMRLLGIEVSPARMECALLPLKTLKKAVGGGKEAN